MPCVPMCKLTHHLPPITTTRATVPHLATFHHACEKKESDEERRMGVAQKSSPKRSSTRRAEECLRGEGMLASG